ncbi:hypothetical protein R3P38DRAFT_2530591 [Favolaschia claudopus]|uniref:Uncharacterized protein n=1 Tax=Favolaschia claudopus TaxID=2862362 RepID=A0AAW0BGM3_9AGAR
MDSDSSGSPLLGLACRYLPHDQWFTTHVDPDWKIRQVKSWLLSKCLPYAAPPSPPLRQSARKYQRPPSPITFAPDPRHRPISPITFAMPKPKVNPDDASEFEERDEVSELELKLEPEESPLAPQPKKRTVLPTASTSAKGDIYSQFTLIRFSTGQLLEDDLPLSFYDMRADELLELHRAGVVVTLPRANPKRYLEAYWEGAIRILRMRPIEDEEDSYHLYKIRPLETRALDWRDRWLVVREGNIYLCKDETILIHTLALADLIQLTNSGLPATAHSPSKSRIILARFSSVASTRASSPINPFDSDSSNLSSPVFAHDSDDSNRPRRKMQHKRQRKRSDPEYLALDLKEDAAYVSLLRVLHRHALPRSSFVDKLPVGSADLIQPSPISARPDDNEEEAEDAPPPLRHPPSLAHLRIPRGLSLGAVQFPEWRTSLLHRAHSAGLGDIGKAMEWRMRNGETPEEPFWMHEISPISKRGRNTRRRSQQVQIVRQPTSTDGYDSDVSGDGSGSGDEEGYVDEESDEGSNDGRAGGGTRSETEWVGWMGDLRRQARVATEEKVRLRQREEMRRLAEETRDAELGLPPMPPGAIAEVTISRVGTGVDDRQRRAALEPSAVVTSLSGVNPPSHPFSHQLQYHHLHLNYAATPSASSSAYSHSTQPTPPVLSSPSSNESIGFAFSPLAPVELADQDTNTTTTPGSVHSRHSHSRAHSHTHTLLHSVSMQMPPLNFPPSHGGTGPVFFDAFSRRPSMPVIGSSGRWGGEDGSRPSTPEPGGSSTATTGIAEVARASVGRSGSISGGGKGLLRKKDQQRERERERDKDQGGGGGETSDYWRKGKEKERERERSPPPPNTHLTALASRRPRLSVSTTEHPRVPRTQALSPPGTPVMADQIMPLPDPAPAKKKRKGLARGVSIRAEKLVKSLDSALDFVDGR